MPATSWAERSTLCSRGLSGFDAERRSSLGSSMLSAPGKLWPCCLPVSQDHGKSGMPPPPFLSSPTTFSTTFAAERRPGGYSSSCRPPGDKDTTALFIAFVSYPLNPKYRFPLQLTAPALCPFPAPCWSSPALAAVIVIPVKRSGVNQTVSLQQKKSIFQVLETQHNSGQVRLS